MIRYHVRYVDVLGVWKQLTGNTIGRTSTASCQYLFTFLISVDP